MRINARVVEDVTVLMLSGRMIRNKGFGTLPRRIEDLIQEGRRKVVLNLAAVSYMDSTCVGELVSSLLALRRSGGTLHLANLTEHVERLMTVTGLTAKFQTFGTEQEAVDSLTATPRES